MVYLIINAGSSSLKFSLFDADSLQEILHGSVTGIGFDQTTFQVAGEQSEDTESSEVRADDHEAAAGILKGWLAQKFPEGGIEAIGHRVVHGGPYYHSPCLITDEVVTNLQNVIPFDPEHLPVEIALITSLRSAFPTLPQIASFDTAFHADLPIESRLLPLPRKYEAEGIRRYGFHGLSYAYLLQEFERVAGPEAAHGRVIMAHLGNGASLVALKDGKPLDTSMGLTPAGGVPMSTRAGDLDPGVMTYLARHHNLSVSELDHIIGFESGLLGISETTSDMKKLLDTQQDDPRAADAINIFCYQVRKFIGAYAAVLGGLDSLIFSGGIGEVAPLIRARICDGLGFLGIGLDAERNGSNAELVSADGASVGVHVLQTNEAATMAQDIATVLKQT